MALGKDVGMDQSKPSAADNHVFLRGVLAEVPRVRTMPSGDELCSFRLTVPRPKGSFGRTRVDSIECATTRLAARKAAVRLAPGEVLEVTGSLRRRFWRTGSGSATSRYEVDVFTACKAKGGSMSTSPAKSAPAKSVKRKPRAAKSVPANP
jgi:single-strand DNA-binding protein